MNELVRRYLSLNASSVLMSLRRLQVELSRHSVATHASVEDLTLEEARLIKWAAVNIYVGGSDTVLVSQYPFDHMFDLTFHLADCLWNEDLCPLYAS
jgi:hypothetical protein